MSKTRFAVAFAFLLGVFGDLDAAGTSPFRGDFARQEEKGLERIVTARSRAEAVAVAAHFFPHHLVLRIAREWPPVVGDVFSRYLLILQRAGE
jgi:hypothetical protein